MTRLAYSEYEDEHGRVAMLYDPENHEAWLRSNLTTAVRR
jgi:hypothetical protein